MKETTLPLRYVRDSANLPPATNCQVIPLNFQGAANPDRYFPHNCHDHLKFYFQIKKFKSSSMDCQKPNLLLCMRCYRTIEIKCGQTYEDKCLSCSKYWKSLRKEQLSIALCRAVTWTEMTLTLRGLEYLPFDKSLCNHDASMKCTLVKGCKINEGDLSLANAKALKQYDDLCESIKKKYGREVKFIKVAERQKRGAIHFHVLILGLPLGSRPDKIKFLRSKIKAYGFGKQSVIKSSDSKSDLRKVVAYCTKYLTKSTDRCLTVNLKTGEIRAGGYWRISMSRGISDSVAQIKSDRRERYLASLSAINEGGEVGRSTMRSREESEAPPLDNSKECSDAYT